MIRFRFSFLIIVISVFVGTSGFGQVSPEIQLGARGVMSFNIDNSTETTSSAVNDFSDTGLLIGFREKLYNSYRGQMVIGFQFPDAGSDLGDVFFHQVFLKVENKTNILKMGRSRVRGALIEFPTLRDDDALFFTDILNPFSSGQDTEDNQFGNVVEVNRFLSQRFIISLHGEHFRESPIPPAVSETDFGLNAIGATFEYRVPETQRWNRHILNQFGVGFNNYLTDRPGFSKDIDKALKNISASAVLNARPDPVHFWDLRFQTIYNVGFDEVTEIVDHQTMAKARSFSTFAAVRYLYRKLERPTAQFALAFGYKLFPDLAAETDQFAIIANGFYRLGQQFDVGVQYQFRKASGDLATLYEKEEHRINLALVFSIDQSWNNQFDDRESLLNLEHGYIP